MATPRVTIDQLPIQDTIEDANQIIVQDTGVTKRLAMSVLRADISIPLAAHLADTVDAHDATAISTTTSGTGVDATTVQLQLGQLATLVNGKISQTVADGRYVNLDGDTMTGPLILVRDPLLALEAATMKYVDDKVLAAGGGISQADADTRYVNVSGDTMIGSLIIATGATAGLSLRRSGDESPYIEYRTFDGTSRYAALSWNNASNQLRLSTEVASAAIAFWTAGAQRGYVGDNSLNMSVPVLAEGVSRFGSASVLFGASAYLALHDAATDRNTIGTRSGYMGISGGTLQINAEKASLPVDLKAQGQIGFWPGGLGEQGRFTTLGVFLVGKTAADNQATKGCELRPDGTHMSTVNTVNDLNYWSTKIGTADAASQRHMTFRRTTSATEIGSIAVNSSNNGVLFNQTSHGPWKDVIGPLPDDEAITQIRRFQPVMYRWKYNAEGVQTRDGSPQGDPQFGFVAQDHLDVAPAAVNPEQGVEGEEGFSPAGFDYGRITPNIVAALQAALNKIDELTARVAELETA